MGTDHGEPVDRCSVSIPPGLEIAADYIQHGTPVFVAPPNSEARKEEGRGEFDFPIGWNRLEPDLDALKNWEPGWAVCAVTGWKFDVLDIDPRNDGFSTLSGLYSGGLVPEVYGTVLTPSGGKHLYICPTGLSNLKPWRGIDLQAGKRDGTGHGFVYITPTVRTDKRSGELKVYTMRSLIDWEGLSEATKSSADRDFFLFVYGIYKRKEAAKKAKKVWEPLGRTAENDEERAALAKILAKICSNMEETLSGERNDTLNRLSYFLGRVISGSGLERGIGMAALKAAALNSGLPEREIEYHLTRGVDQGVKQPYRLMVFRKEEIEAEENSVDNYLDEYDRVIDVALGRSRGDGTS